MHLIAYIALVSTPSCHSVSAHMRDHKRFQPAPFQPTSCVTTVSSTTTRSCIYSGYPITGSAIFTTPLSTSTSWSSVPAYSTPVKWQIVLDKNTEVRAEKDVDVYDIDLDSSVDTFRTLRDAGKYIICYFSAGTSENFRADDGCFNPNLGQQDLGCNFGGPFPNEYWLNTSSIEVRAIMLNRLDKAQKLCDAVDPDNIDSYTNPNGIGATFNDSKNYILWLSKEAHARGLAIGLKNSGELANDTDVVKAVEFAVNEECVVMKECDMFPSSSRHQSRSSTSSIRPMFLLPRLLRKPSRRMSRGL